ncbi:MAG TPA: acyl carrier protein [Methylibium sp.]
MDHTIEQLKQLIHEQFDIAVDSIDADAPFASYNLDSLTVAELVFAIEDQFHVDFPNDLSQIQTLRDLAGVLDALPRREADTSPSTA